MNKKEIKEILSAFDILKKYNIIPNISYSKDDEKTYSIYYGKENRDGPFEHVIILNIGSEVKMI